MKWLCIEDCYFASNLWKNGDQVEGEKFAQNKYFQPMDNEALALCQEAGRQDEVNDFFDTEVEPDPELMKKSVQELRNLYYDVEWKATMRKPDFVKEIMKHGHSG